MEKLKKAFFGVWLLLVFIAAPIHYRLSAQDACRSSATQQPGVAASCYVNPYGVCWWVNTVCQVEWCRSCADGIEREAHTCASIYYACYSPSGTSCHGTPYCYPY